MNLFGLSDTALAADLNGFDWSTFLGAVRQPVSIHARHTVGMVDPLTDTAERVADGLPETLAEVVAAYQPHYFKLKLGGDLAADIARLEEIAGILDQASDSYWVTLDGNEQYRAVDELAAFLAAFAAAPSLRRMHAATLLLEQPLQRSITLTTPITDLKTDIPVIIDESDADFASFPDCSGAWLSGRVEQAMQGTVQIFAEQCPLPAARRRYLHDGGGFNHPGRPRGATRPGVGACAWFDPCRAQRTPLCRWNGWRGQSGTTRFRCCPSGFV